MGEGGGLEGAKDRGALVQMGPFTGADGTERWGIEIVGSEAEAGVGEGVHQGGGEQEEIQHGDPDEEHAEDYAQAEEQAGAAIPLVTMHPLTPAPT